MDDRDTPGRRLLRDRGPKHPVVRIHIESPNIKGGEDRRDEPVCSETIARPVEKRKAFWWLDVVDLHLDVDARAFNCPPAVRGEYCCETSSVRCSRVAGRRRDLVLTRLPRAGCQELDENGQGDGQGDDDHYEVDNPTRFLETPQGEYQGDEIKHWCSQNQQVVQNKGRYQVIAEDRLDRFGAFPRAGHEPVKYCGSN
jgi:hypothetical protein